MSSAHYFKFLGLIRTNNRQHTYHRVVSRQKCPSHQSDRWECGQQQLALKVLNSQQFESCLFRPFVVHAKMPRSHSLNRSETPVPSP